MTTTPNVRSGQPRIPLFRPFITGKEIGYITKVVTPPGISSDGPFAEGCARLLEERFGIKRVLMTPSCTAALEMAAILCDLHPGDEVILPSFTFVSTANALVRLGARPVFVDIRPDTQNLDESLIEAAITPRTRAIIPVHYAGVACEMGRILEIARDHRLRVIEDAAQGVNASYGGRAQGSLGDLGAYSFHHSKALVCGEGGALCCNTPELIKRAEIIRDKGTNRAQFFRGDVDKYTWVDVGSSYIPSEISCAFLYAQLEMMDVIKDRCRAADRRYRDGLGPLEEAGLLRLPSIPDGCGSNHCAFFVVLNSRATRDRLMDDLRRDGIAATFHYIPLHSSPMGVRFGYREGDLPVTEDMSGRLLRLPLFADLTEQEQSRVVDRITSYLGEGKGLGPSRARHSHAVGSLRNPGAMEARSPDPERIRDVSPEIAETCVAQAKCGATDLPQDSDGISHSAKLNNPHDPLIFH